FYFSSRRLHTRFSRDWSSDVCSSGLSCMIFEARSSSRRCTNTTSDANFVRKFASSIAESPPPTTMIFLPRKKKPSHVAQVLTPRSEERRAGKEGRSLQATYEQTTKNT